MPVLNAITKKLIKSPSHMCDALIFLAQIGRVISFLEMDAWNLPKRVNRFYFLDDLKSINRPEFEKLYNSELLQDDEF